MLPENFTYKSTGRSKKPSRNDLWEKRCDYSFTFQGEKYIFEFAVSSGGLLQEVSFYLKAHRDSNKRYEKLTKDNNVIGFLNCVFHIMEQMTVNPKHRNHNPHASFIFTGHPLPAEKNPTKRFIVYRYRSTKFLTEGKPFSLFGWEESSSLLWLHHHEPARKTVQERLEDVFGLQITN